MNLDKTEQTRRVAIAVILAAGSAMAIGCGPADRATQNRAEAPSSRSSNAPLRLATMTVYRDPGCGCCEKWAAHARQAGYQVNVIDSSNMVAVKREFDVPEELSSCHTTIVGGYVIEGHVPLHAVAGLVKNRPANIQGIAVAGMPRGAPGMEMPYGQSDEFQVMAFDSSGRTSIFRA